MARATEMAASSVSFPDRTRSTTVFRAAWSRSVKATSSSPRLGKPRARHNFRADSRDSPAPAATSRRRSLRSPPRRRASRDFAAIRSAERVPVVRRFDDGVAHLTGARLLAAAIIIVHLFHLLSCPSENRRRNSPAHRPNPKISSSGSSSIASSKNLWNSGNFRHVPQHGAKLGARHPRIYSRSATSAGA